MDNPAPPVYSESVSRVSPDESETDTPPAFEPGSALPITLMDSKPALNDSQPSTPPPNLPKRICVPNASISELPPPPTLVINNKAVGPFDLVTVGEVKAHLVFLGAFARLKAEVKSQKGVDVRGSTDELWSIYIARAVHRFAVWASKGLPADLDDSVLRPLTVDEVPPLDVLMAWHAYMLNPRVYFEDGVTKKSRLMDIRAFPLDLFDKVVDVDTLVALHPSPERQQKFESLTGQPWLCPLNTTVSDTTFVPCPRCEDKTRNEVCWITNENTGFAQHDFKARCHKCMGVFDRNEMMVRGVCDDIIQVRLGLTHKSVNIENQPFISGTLLNWRTGEPDYRSAIRNNEILLKHFLTAATMKFTRGDWLAGSIKFSMKRLEANLKEGLQLRGGGAQVTRILSYYRCPYYPFSIELCGAILRQGSFIDKMTKLGWTEPHTFNEDPTTLVRCIARYSAWLDVMAQWARNYKMLVPTLDIDLAWHTHQLKHQDYRTSTLAMLGQPLDHDDKVEENKLSDAFEQTAKYWEQRWGVPYHICGCPQPPTNKPFNPGETLSKLFRGKGKAKPPAEFSNPRPQLVSTHDCDSPLTHPSEHNSILVFGQPLSESRRVERVQRYSWWGKQVRSDVEKGKVPPDGWQAMNLQRAEGHEIGFMRPMPDPNLTPVVPYGAETCAAHDGGVLYAKDLSVLPTDGKYSAGACAAGMGYYGMWPMGGFYIGPMGSCAGAANGACGGSSGATSGGCVGGCGGGCGGVSDTPLLENYLPNLIPLNRAKLGGTLWARVLPGIPCEIFPGCLSN